jgi:hypothetical protein
MRCAETMLEEKSAHIAGRVQLNALSGWHCPGPPWHCDEHFPSGME